MGLNRTHRTYKTREICRSYKFYTSYKSNP
jgi:hypothetical protein